MKKVLMISAMLFGLMFMAGCKSKEKSVDAPAPVAQGEPISMRETGEGMEAMAPRASAFRMTGDYADRVAVTLGADGELRYFPAPTDLREGSEPTPIGDGWWLNNQGLGPESVFTKWTFAEYRALKSVPTPAEIKAAVIPGARVSAFRRLPMSPEAARSAGSAELLKQLGE